MLAFQLMEYTMCLLMGLNEAVSLGFWFRTYKSISIGECTGVLRNYSISKLKLCRNLTSTQAKNEFPSSLDSSLESKWKML